MKSVWRTVGWTGLVLAVALGYAAYRTFWGKPFTINVLANRQAFEFLVRNPELATAVGIAEGSFVAYHSDKLEPSTFKQRDDTYPQLAQFLKELHWFDRAHLKAIGGKLDEATAEMQRQAKAGVVLPAALLDRSLTVIRDTVAGKPEENTLVTTFVARMGKVRSLQPARRLERVPASQEKRASGAYYQQAAMDGSRPGTSFADLRDMKACAYKVGQLKILELRAKARAALGPKFDLKDFHPVILENGGVPLAVLEQLVGEWIARTRVTAP